MIQGIHERKFYLPPGAGTFSPLTMPHRIRNQKKGDGTPSWLKLQALFTDLLYGKTLQPNEKVFAMILYDQLFRWSNKHKGEPDTDYRRSLRVTPTDWGTALGIDPRTARSAGKSLQDKGIIRYEEGAGFLRLSFVWNDPEEPASGGGTNEPPTQSRLPL